MCPHYKYFLKSSRDSLKCTGASRTFKADKSLAWPIFYLTPLNLSNWQLYAQKPLSQCSPVHISALYLSHENGKETSIKKLGIGETAEVGIFLL